MLSRPFPDRDDHAVTLPFSRPRGPMMVQGQARDDLATAAAALLQGQDDVMAMRCRNKVQSWEKWELAASAFGTVRSQTHLLIMRLYNNNINSPRKRSGVDPRV